MTSSSQRRLTPNEEEAREDEDGVGEAE